MLHGFFVASGNFGEQIEKLFFARQETHGISGAWWTAKIAALWNDN